MENGNGKKGGNTNKHIHNIFIIIIVTIIISIVIAQYMFYSITSASFILLMLFCRNNIASSFFYMGRNRKTLGGGKWGEAMMESIMNTHLQQQRHNGSGKQTKPRNWEKYVPPFSRPSSASPSPYSTHNKSPKNFKKKNSYGYRLNNDSNEPLYKPRTANQALYLKYLMDDRVKIVLGVGPAGCGKTLFACHRAVECLIDGGIQKIVITRPMVSVEDESVGFLPGDMTQKMAPWTRPIFDIFHEYFDPLDVQDMIRRGVIEISPLAYMRGRTFKNAFIIADEMQNSTPNQMLMLTTRLGEDAKMAITGDLKQSDKGLENNGLSDFMRKLYGYRRAKMAQEAGEEKGAMGGFLGVKLVQLCSTDVCRSEIVTRVLDMYQIATEIPSVASILTDSDYGRNNANTWQDDSDMEGGEIGAIDDLVSSNEAERTEESDVKSFSVPLSKPYSSGMKSRKPDKNNMHQPKPKRHQTYVIEEPEYQDDFKKNLKKVIENALKEDKPPVVEKKPEEEQEQEEEQEYIYTQPLPHPNNENVSVKITVSSEELDAIEFNHEITSDGSSDCALIPKKEEERGRPFRFFS